ncbi:DUF4350 domain-containing protein [Mycobacterium barrassiae]|uniref:DUF4350 domain-containing protein n=1 Tax=Mycobacterium barrassiae TaxID=319709 RepID=UPI002265C9DD|nr:DUF4350 domain-containing protein [Mycobacterium barrassiae]MCV7303493.1 DUF4350 domain-containing protein [Mycobacterium barrassiae]
MTDTAVGTPLRQRWSVVRWVLLALVVVVGIAALSTYLTAPRPGGPMDPTSTSPDGARALVTLLREGGVEVIEAPDIATAERAARPDTLIAVLQTFQLLDEDVLHRLTDLPGDRLLVSPTSATREALAPRVRLAGAVPFGGADPGCDLREAIRAGDVQLGMSDKFMSADDFPITSCYGGALVRYSDDGRTITVVGSSDFMTNGGLLAAGNAALALNLAGTHPRVIWYAPQQREGYSDSGVEIGDLIPPAVKWIIFQLCVAIALVALWKGRRLGPLVAERMPVVVRASETVEGRGRLYRSRRARDRAADALRTAALQRMLPRLGLANNAAPPAIVSAIAQRAGTSPETLAHTLFGPPPQSDDDLVNLARELDNIERQVAQS